MSMSVQERARDKAFWILLCIFMGLMGATFLFALIIGPIIGQWAPDIAFSIVAVIVGIWWGLAKFLEWRTGR